MSQVNLDPFKTQNPQTVYIDLVNRTAVGTFQWLLEKSHSHPIHKSNTLCAFIGGEEGFAAIAADLKAAVQGYRAAMEDPQNRLDEFANQSPSQEAASS